MFLMVYQYHELATLFYGLSSLLDALDGVAARYLNQCSRFGAVLDMITDRSSTSILLCYLYHYYASTNSSSLLFLPPLFQFLLALDLSSHYIHMVASHTAGESSHKIIPADANPLLKWYYQSRIVLFFVCAGNELFFILLYVYSFIDLTNFSLFAKALLYSFTLVSFSVCLLKQIINVIQFVRASNFLVQQDVSDIQSRSKYTSETSN